MVDSNRISLNNMSFVNIEVRSIINFGQTINQIHDKAQIKERGNHYFVRTIFWRECPREIKWKTFLE